MGFDWKKTLGAVAPTICTAIGGPFGALAGGLINAALGLGDDADDAARAKALEKATPEQLLAIQQADQKFKIDIASLGVDLERISADDRKDARNREIQLRDWAPRVLAVMVIGGWVWLNYYIFTDKLPEGNKDYILRTLGTVDFAVGLVLSFFYGSSSESASKNALLVQAGGK